MKDDVDGTLVHIDMWNVADYIIKYKYAAYICNYVYQK